MTPVEQLARALCAADNCNPDTVVTSFRPARAASTGLLTSYYIVHLDAAAPAWTAYLLTAQLALEIVKES